MSLTETRKCASIAIQNSNVQKANLNNKAFQNNKYVQGRKKNKKLNGEVALMLAQYFDQSKEQEKLIPFPVFVTGL